MGKQKFEEFKRIEIVGVLDNDENGNRIIRVEDEEYNLDETIDKMMGYQIELKCSM